MTRTITITTAATITLALSASFTLTAQHGKPKPPPQPPPIAILSVPATGTVNVSMTIDGSASHGQNGNTIKSWSYAFGDGTSKNGTGAVVAVPHTYLTSGTKTIKLSVTDNKNGKASTTASTSISAPTPPPQTPPTAVLVAPSTGTVGIPVTLDGSSSHANGGNFLQGYQYLFGDGGFQNGSGTPAVVTHLYATNATFSASVTVTDNTGATNAASASIAIGTQPSSVGPQPSITCPVGATPVSAGANLVTTVSGAPANTVFCLAAGTYSPTASINMKDGDALIGTYGAIIDGSGVAPESDAPSSAIIRGWGCPSSAPCNNVVLQNLVIKNFAGHKCIGGYGAYTNNWTIDHNEIFGCTESAGDGYGVSVGGANSSGLRVTYNSIHDNGCAVGQGQLLNALFDHNDLSVSTYTSCKVAVDDYALGRVTNITVTNNTVHDNGSGVVGIWFDTEGTGNLIASNTVTASAGAAAIMNEATTGTEIHDNTVTVPSSGSSIGIFISNSRAAYVHDNTITTSGGFAINIYYDGVFSSFTPGAETIAHNSITLPVTQAPLVGFACGLSTSACQTFWNTSGSTFTNSVYTLGTPGGSYWYYGGGAIPFATWQGYGFN